jgi:hypothetical protein
MDHVIEQLLLRLLVLVTHVLGQAAAGCLVASISESVNMWLEVLWPLHFLPLAHDDELCLKTVMI